MNSEVNIIVSPHKFGLKSDMDRIFLYLMLKSLVKSNPTANIVFPNPNGYPIGISGITEFYYDPDDVPEVKRLRDVYRHLSTNDFLFELACIERFYTIRMIMKNFNISNAYTIESDCLIFKPINLLHSHNIKNSNECLLTNDSCISTAFVTLDFLEEYCSEVIGFYTNEKILSEMIDWHRRYISDGKMGGICDMTFCSSLKTGWITNKSSTLISNFNDTFSIDGRLFAYDNFLSDEYFANDERSIFMGKTYEDDKKFKKFKINNGNMTVNFIDNTEIELCSVHCQGGNKKLMGLIYAEMF